MRRIQTGIAILCAFLMLTPYATAQQIRYIQDQTGGPLSSLTNPYQVRQAAPVNLSNSTRLDALLRAGNIYLSLQDAIALALENNLDIEIQRYARPQAEASLARAQAGGPLRGVSTSIETQSTNTLSQLTGGSSSLFSSGGSGGSSSSSTGAGLTITSTGTSVPSLDPAVYFGGSWGHSTSLQPNNFSVGTTNLIYRNYSYQGGIQKSFLTGTSAQLGWSQQTVKSNVAYQYQPPNPYTSGNLDLYITQHLLQGFSLAANTRYIRVAKNNLKTSDLVFKQQVIYTVAAVVQGYWDLVSYIENVKVKQQALEVAQKQYDDNRKQVEIGTLAPIEIVKAEAEVANYQQQLVTAQTTLLQQETALKNALSRTGVASPQIADAHIIPTDHITIPETEPVIPIQDLTSKALENRVELAQTRINLESSKIQLTGSKNLLLPSLDVFANLQNNGISGQPNPIPSYDKDGNLIPAVIDPFFQGGQGRLLSQLFGRNFPNYSMGVSLNIPLRNRSAQADYISDSLSLRQQELRLQGQLNSIRQEVRNAQIAVQQATASYHAAVKARELAQQTLDAEQKKYTLGASTLFVVIQYQRDLATAKATEVQAQSTYAKAKVQMDVATGQTLDRYAVSMDEAVKGRVAKQPGALPAAQ